MAEKQAKEELTPEPVKQKEQIKSGTILQSILVVFLALLIVVLVSLGVFYIAIKNNISGVAYVFKPYIENHPILKLALPSELLPKEPDDPDDPKYLTQKELLTKYEEYRKKVKELNERLDKANQTIKEFNASEGKASQASSTLAENQAVLQSIKEEQAKLEADEKKLAELIANGDTKGFKDYFQKVDKATAEAIYKEILLKEAIDEDKVLLAKPFSTMKPESAASVLTELYAKDKETLLDIFEGLKSSASALILEKMDAKTAADITKLLSDRKDR